MSQATACPVERGTACLGPASLSLADVRRRFRQEAVRGVFFTGRYRCSYFAWGSGPPLVFVPGLSDSGLSFVQPIARLAEHSSGRLRSART